MNEILRFFATRSLPFELAIVSRIGLNYCPLHRHRTLELVYHATGHGLTHITGFTTLTFEPGAVIIYPPAAAHDQTMHSTGEDWCVHFLVPHDLPDMLRSPIYAPPTSDPDIGHEFDYLMHANRKAQGLLRHALNQRATSLLLRLLAAANLSRTSADNPISAYALHAQEFVQTRFRELRTLEDVAQHVGISAHYLRHLYRKQYGISIKQAILRARIEHAAKLLTHSAMPLKAIALDCGFQTDRYFSSVFRHSEGMPPGQYRRIHSN